MSKNQNQHEEELIKMRKLLVENAFDFLERAISEFAKDDLKYSVIHFCTAVEQFLKARVMQDGWELILQTDDKRDFPPTFAEFKAGKLRTIGVGQCCQHLKDKISNAEKKAFGKLARHRNKVVHFYHPTIDAEKVRIAQEQSRCWFILKRFLDNLYRHRIEAIDEQRSLYHPYLQTIYDQKSAVISTLKILLSRRLRLMSRRFLFPVFVLQYRLCVIRKRVIPTWTVITEF